MSLSKLFAGVLLVAAGFLLLLQQLGVISFSLSGFAIYWPVTLILIGIAVLLNARILAIALVILTVLFAGVMVIQDITGQVASDGQMYQITKEIPFDPEVQKFTISVGHGAGSVNITKGDKLVSLNISTSDPTEPEFDYIKDGNVARLSMRKNVALKFPRTRGDHWDIGLSSEPALDLELDYGAAELYLDMTELKIDKLAISTGASSSKIILGKYPTRMSFDAGASSVELLFPKDYPVKVFAEGGAISTELKGFKKEGKQYLSPGYDENAEHIEVRISAGATSINGDFY